MQVRLPTQPCKGKRKGNRREDLGERTSIYGCQSHDHNRRRFLKLGLLSQLFQQQIQKKHKMRFKACVENTVHFLYIFFFSTDFS